MAKIIISTLAIFILIWSFYSNKRPELHLGMSKPQALKISQQILAPQDLFDQLDERIKNLEDINQDELESLYKVAEELIKTDESRYYNELIQREDEFYERDFLMGLFFIKTWVKGSSSPQLVLNLLWDKESHQKDSQNRLRSYAFKQLRILSKNNSWVVSEVKKTKLSNWVLNKLKTEKSSDVLLEGLMFLEQIESKKQVQKLLSYRPIDERRFLEGIIN